MRVIWDDAKNRSNQKKHGVSFEEAAVLFARGDDYLEIFDEARSDEEDRFIAIGPVVRGVAPAGRRSGRRNCIGTMFAGGHHDGDS